MRRTRSILGLWLLVATLLSGCSVSIRAASSGLSNASPTAQSSASPTVIEPTAASGTPTGVALIPTPTITPSPAPDPTTQPTATPATARPTTPATQPTPQSTRQPLPTPTPVPAGPTPTPKPSGPPSCANVPLRGFGLLWSSNVSIAQAVGCPDSSEAGLAARVQVFEHGYMLWLQTSSAGVDQSDWVVTVIDGTAARYRVPSDVPPWDDASTEPTGAFQWVWENVYTDRAKLGNPVAPEYQTDSALQFFDSGTMIWLQDPPSAKAPQILVVQANLQTAARGDAELYPDLSYS